MEIHRGASVRSLLKLFLKAKLLRDPNHHKSQFLCTGQYLGHVFDKLDSDTVQKNTCVDIFANST